MQELMWIAAADKRLGFGFFFVGGPTAAIVSSSLLTF
jgi:hypothetical protein